MTFGSFMKWDTWKCLVVRNPWRKNVFPFGDWRETWNHLTIFRHYLSLLEKLVVRCEKTVFFPSRLVMKTRILDFKTVFIPGGALGGGGAAEAAPAPCQGTPALLFFNNPWMKGMKTECWGLGAKAWAQSASSGAFVHLITVTSETSLPPAWEADPATKFEPSGC